MEISMAEVEALVDTRVLDTDDNWVSDTDALDDETVAELVDSNRMSEADED